MIVRKEYLFLGLLVASSYPFSGFAARQQIHVPISLEITGSCIIDSDGIDGFGKWAAGSPNLSNVPLGTLSVNCPTGVNYFIGIDQGLHFEDNQRNMSDGTHDVAYSLWNGNSGTAVEWGDGGLGDIEPSYIETYPAPAFAGIGNGNVQTISIQGSAEISEVPPGNYQDDVIITIVW